MFYSSGEFWPQSIIWSWMMTYYDNRIYFTVSIVGHFSKFNNSNLKCSPKKTTVHAPLSHATSQRIKLSRCQCSWSHRNPLVANSGSFIPSFLSRSYLLSALSNAHTWKLPLEMIEYFFRLMIQTPPNPTSI